ncbi:hypothetical protein [Saccharopolyspora oryzae]|uniref:Uncharacterized protein n=1 Tax=Saccharopolyspora oryzae TaxID=2997343 RepID=A0ABT4VAW4_9PSEU|nr:hypothetical protein [Saccharopolyspora oryzae]MDA3631110.1 hypothetical protein [Saccharopolyspora oryzae]
MARDADRGGSAGNSGILSRIDKFCWIPVVPMLLLALLVVILFQIYELSLLLLVGALIILGFDLWVNSRNKSAAPRQPRRAPRDDDDFFGDADDRPRREPARRPARQAPQGRPAAARGGAPRGGATRAANPPRGGQGRPQQRPGGRPGVRR